MKKQTVLAMVIVAVGLGIWTIKTGEAVPKHKPTVAENKLVHNFIVAPGETVYAGEAVVLVDGVVKNSGAEGLVVGVAEADASEGETIPVVISGIADNYVNLVPGSYYNLQDDGSLATDPNVWRIGIAVSPTELLLLHMPVMIYIDGGEPPIIIPDPD